jgi:hypothetical protein
VGTGSVCAQRIDSSTRRTSGEPPYTILALGDVSTSERQLDAISHALSTIEELGLCAGLFSTVIRTDTQLVTKGAIVAATGTLTYYKNLDDFDAVLMFVQGNPPLGAHQKADLLSFVRSGKGLIAIDTTLSAFDSWPEFHQMLGTGKSMWTRRYGRGRVFVTRLGHEEQEWDQEAFQRTILEGVRWAIGSRSPRLP